MGRAGSKVDFIGYLRHWGSCWLLMSLAISSTLAISSSSSSSIEEPQPRTRNHGNGHHGKHHSIPKQSPQDSYQIVIPQIIQHTAGNMIVNDVKNFVRRRKRMSGMQKKPLEISITGRGENFELELWENDDLFAPGFKIYRRNNLADNTTEKEVAFKDDDVFGCHFTGKVKSHADGPASLSICDGMKGIIRTSDDDYIIEPVQEVSVHGNHGFVGQPHKLYKRSLMDVHHQHQYEAKNTVKKNIVIEKGEDGEDELEIDEKSEIFIGEDDNDDEDDTALDTQLNGLAERSKRSLFKYKFQRELNKPKTVEMLVVVDKNMYHKHGDANITTYTLTLFNMLSQLFKDGSIGSKINVVLVGLILLEGDEHGLSIDYNADDTLNSFCSWQSVLVGANGRQHDHAILLTGLDLCSYKNAPCDTLGFAPMEGMCNRIRSCTVNEDTGLSTAFTIAHEVGHNFGMFHDGEGNYCTESAGKIMSPTLMGKDGQFHWSVCSKAYLMRFLNTPQSDCLDDRPKQVAELKFPDKLPGELYNADIQCKWQFGRRARLCTYDFGKDICKALWCYRGNKRCETKFLPAAEGTSCGKGKWCRQGKCVDYGHNGPKPIDGGWSSWTEWSECSRSCGGGVITRERECSRPLPQYGGKTCGGEERIYKMCNVHACPDDAEDFHASQCSTYNKQPFQGWYLQWKPQKRLNDVTEPCKLHCIADTPSYVFTIKHTATDGMTCGVEEGNICVEGDCQDVGCDWIIGSQLHNDICGVCDGDNSTCRLIQGEYTEQPDLNTYFPVTILPKNARSIRISEKSLSSNYLAVKNIYGTYFLNGHQRVAWPGTYDLGGAKFKYSRPYNEPETLEAEGPLEEELVLEILVQDRNPGIQYEYTLPKTAEELETPTEPNNYTWSMSVSSCSEPCAGGKKHVSAICHKNFVEEVEPSFCVSQEEPETGVLPCNEEPCQPRWVSAEWSQCSRECGRGKQKRSVKCRQKVSQGRDKKLKRKACSHAPRPARWQRCNEHECPPGWHTGRWNKCSVTCGEGQEKRKVTCRSKKGRKILPDSMCHEVKPNATRPCEREPCAAQADKAMPEPATPCDQPPCEPRWRMADWGVCSKACGGGVQKRKVWCENSAGVQVKNRHCPRPDKPPRKQKCNKHNCEAAWHLGRWTECSMTCGQGMQKREISCRTKDGHHLLEDSTCGQQKVDMMRSCDLGPCDKPQEKYDWLLSPWGPCSETCGIGRVSRYLRCAHLSDGQRPMIVQENFCQYIPKPRTHMSEECSIMKCKGGHSEERAYWKLTEWSECSRSCGEGVQSRIVSCISSRGQPSNNCDQQTRPDHSQACNEGECLPTPLRQTQTCDDKFGWCRLVNSNVCLNPLYSKNCCKSCNQR